MKRFYRYIIYRLYDKALKKPSFTPVLDTITPLAILHMLMFFVVAQVFCMLVIHGPLPLLEHMGLMIIFVIFNLWVHYILFYDKKSWSNIMEEFKDESPAERRKGGWYVVGYLVGGSLLCLALLGLVVWIGVRLHLIS
ncbi:hypothetical protein HHL17_12055 [Chitinophaga sp. G-6-1-13]|uniref:Uncharacterized protein n=1 Tax=Chitinophaga fulva TaxID=2728842 RepID=A0A848GKK1_9BACT|nr:hypothetical protein [Chitinophaga fulva]NML37929.1 hypothetical protein [Chitinophaga fulva]